MKMSRDDRAIMKEEINRRKESDGWNFRIAQNVLERRRSRKRKTLFSGMTAAAATAADSIILVTGLRDEAVQNDFSSFISKQVTGTYYLVFNGNGSERAGSDDALLLSDDIDSMINNVMSMR
jgi:hypothetical protein